MILRLSLNSRMAKTLKISAFRIAAQLNLKEVKQTVDVKPTSDRSSDLFYSVEADKHMLYLNSGVAVFMNYQENEIAALIDKIKGSLIHPVQRLRQDYAVKVEGESGSELAAAKFESDQVVLGKLDAGIARTIMINMGQNIVLDHYHQLAGTLLKEVRSYSTNLETTGKLRIGRKNMMKFIGRTLNTQNEIAENRHIFAPSEQVCDDPGQESLHQDVQKHLNVRTRVNEIESNLQIIEDNLKVFLQISNQRESNLLEWIIIVLILVEIVNLFVTQWMK